MLTSPHTETQMQTYDTVIIEKKLYFHSFINSFITQMLAQQWAKLGSTDCSLHF